MSSELDYEDTVDLSTRAGGGYLAQVVRIGNANDFPFDLSITRREDLNGLACAVYIRFNIREGNVRLKIDTSSNWEVSMQQVRLSTWFSAFTTIEKPRTPRVGRDYPLKFFKEANETIISCMGWRNYKISSSYQVDSVDLMLLSNMRDVNVDFSKPLTADYVPFESVFDFIKVKGSDVSVQDIFLTYNDATSRRNYEVQRGSKKVLSQIKTEKDLNFSNVLPPPPPVEEEKINPIIYNPVTDVSRVFRLYYTWSVPGDFNRIVESEILFPKVFPKDFVILQQMWYGTSKGDIETFVEMNPTIQNVKIGVAGWENDRFGVFKVDQKNVTRIDGVLPQVFRHTIVKRNDGMLIVFINDVELVKTKQKIDKPNITVGWEFHIPRALVDKLGSENLTKLIDIPNPKFIKIDGEDVKPLPVHSQVNNLNGCGHKLTKANSVGFLRLSEAQQLFEPKAPEEMDKHVVEEQKPTIDKDANKEASIKSDEKNVLFVGTLEKSKLVGINHYLLTPDQDNKIFSTMVKHYRDLGFSTDQAKLIIYQMGVTFGTARGCCSDTSSNLIWTNDKGENVVLKKGEHCKRLNLLSPFACNVERLVLRRRSGEILELLRSRRLLPPNRLAKKKGVSDELAYMACDFLDFSNQLLSQEENLALYTVKQYVRLQNKHRRSIVNVSQLL